MLQQELRTPVPQVATLVQQPLSATNPAYDLSVESSEAHTLAEQPQTVAVATVVTAGQPVLPQSGLMELVSNPLYARSLDVSRTTSTSPIKVDASAAAKQAEPEPDSMLSEVPTGSAIVQVSDQPILSGTDPLESEAASSAVSNSQEPTPEQPVQSSAIAIEDTSAAVHHTCQESELQDNPVVLQVSDQPIFTAPAVGAASADLLSEAKTAIQAAAQNAEGSVPADVASAPQQMSAQPILASTAAITAPAEHQATTVVSDHDTDLSITPVVADSGTAITVSNQPILGGMSSETSQAVEAEAVHMTSSQPLLGAVDTPPGDSGATPLAMQQAPLSLPTVQPAEVQISQQPAQPLQPVMSSQPQLGPVMSQAGALPVATRHAPLAANAVHSQELQTSQKTAQLLTHVGTKPTPDISSQPQLGPVITQPGELHAIPMYHAPLTAPRASFEQLQISQQPAQHMSAEPTPVMSSQPPLGPELVQPQAPPQVQLFQQQQVPLQGLGSAETVPATQPVSGTSTPTTWVSTESQGFVLRPPVPALPSVRRSRSDVRSIQQAGSIRRSISILPATPESAQAPPIAPLRPSPMPQLRRSVTSLPTSPVPQFLRTTAAQPQLQHVVLQQAPLTMPPAYMQVPLGPLQEGIAAAPGAPVQQQAHSRTLMPPPSQPPAAVVLSAAPVLAPSPATPLIDPQEVHLTVTSSPQLYSVPSASTVNVEQQAQPKVLQETRHLQVVPQQPEATLEGQDSAVSVQVTDPGSPVVRQQAELQPQVTQVVEASPLRQHNPPVFMRSFDVGAPQNARSRPAHSSKIMRTNTWSPSPNILQPALPGQAGTPQNVQGPLSMGFQQSWNNPIPVLPEPQPAPLARPPVVRPIERDYAYSSSALPMSIPAQQQTYAYVESMPVQQTDQDFAYERSMPMTSAAAGYATNSRANSTVVSAPMALGSREAYSADAPANMAMYQQPGPLSGGLALQAGPMGHQPPRQQMSMSSRTVPASLAQGTVIQPIQGPVVVGEQSAAVTTEPMLTHPHGFSIQPLNPGQGFMQSNRGLNPALMQAGSPAQQQPEALRQGGGGIAKRILQDFGRSSRSSFNAGASVNTSYQSDRSLQQVMIEGTCDYISCLQVQCDLSHTHVPMEHCFSVLHHISWLGERLSSQHCNRSSPALPIVSSCHICRQSGFLHNAKTSFLAPSLLSYVW